MLNPPMDSPKVSSKKRPNENAEDSKPGASKRSRGKEKSLLVGTGVSLPLEALSFVMEFLSPRQLFNVAFTCKTLRDFISTKLVIRSALIHGGHAHQTMVELHKLMQNKALHIPSPLRLLRLVNGKRCKRCNQSKVNFVRPCVGVFACWDCTTTSLTKPWKMTWARYRDHTDEYDAIFDHPRVATNTYGSQHYMWAIPGRDNSGELIGPLVTLGHVDRMFECAQRGGNLDTYLNDKLKAPPEESYREFNDTFAETQERAHRVQLEREKKKEAAKQKSKGNKLAKIEKMTTDLAALLDEPYRSFALKKTELRYSYDAKVSKLPSVRFTVPFIDDLLKEYVITPSKIRKKILQEMAQTINQKLGLVADKGFVTLDFLSENDPFEAALKAHFSDKLTDLEGLLNMKSETGHWRHRVTKYYVTEEFFILLEKNQLIGALAHLEDGDLGCLLLPENEKEKKLASTLWRSKWLEDDGDDDQRFYRTFAACQTLFPKAKLCLEEFTVWLRKRYPEEEDVRRRFYASTNTSERLSALPLLLEKDFEGLDKM